MFRFWTASQKNGSVDELVMEFLSEFVVDDQYGLVSGFCSKGEGAFCLFHFSFAVLYRCLNGIVLPRGKAVQFFYIGAGVRGDLFHPVDRSLQAGDAERQTRMPMSSAAVTLLSVPLPFLF